jgi:hypothetical protein
VSITDVAWIRDGHSHQVLELKLDGHPFHARSSQRPALSRLGITEGVVFLVSERLAQLPNPFIHGDYAPAFQPRDLIGCTDDPGVFALFQAMSEAIRTDRWRPGPQPTPQ